MVNERRGKNQQNRGKPYDAPAGKGKQKVAQGQRTSRGDAPATVVCFKCGKLGHKSNVCNAEMKSTPLITIIDIVTTHCFIAADCVERLNLTLFAMNGEMVVDLLAKGSVTTSLVRLKCPLSIFDRDFGVDLVCLPLSGLDVVLSMNWLEYNYVHINCYDKSVRFSTPEEEEAGLLSGRQLQQLIQDEETQMFSLMVSLSVTNQVIIEELQVVREFLEVFPNEIPNVPPKREVEFAINLVPATRPVSMAPYMMSASELAELKKKLEDLLEKNCFYAEDKEALSLWF
ncbi:uncharacterized protein LOC131632797 [Vicia villosa]|uniref:uncharacterized protein LOC131632797 n=1 Tax=Vicia villosa TaxID=3911 RepID=UPI00273B4242|nr:uncharacterized protein LOC131632797 [Vicia villosa]